MSQLANTSLRLQLNTQSARGHCWPTLGGIWAHMDTLAQVMEWLALWCPDGQVQQDPQRNLIEVVLPTTQQAMHFKLALGGQLVV